MRAAQCDKAKRREWVKPVLSRLRTGDAENSRAGTKPDALVASS